MARVSETDFNMGISSAYTVRYIDYLQTRGLVVFTDKDEAIWIANHMDCDVAKETDGYILKTCNGTYITAWDLPEIAEFERRTGKKLGYKIVYG